MVLAKAQQKIVRLVQWAGNEHGGIMDEFIVTNAMWIFATVVVMILAGIIWAALSGDIQAMVNVLTNLF